MGCQSEENIWKSKFEKCHNQCFEFIDVLGAHVIPWYSFREKKISVFENRRGLEKHSCPSSSLSPVGWDGGISSGGRAQ